MGRVITPRIIPCHFCQQEIGTPERPFTRDHVVPRSIGGLDERWNVVPACKECNGAKGDDYEFRGHTCAFCKRTKRRHWELFAINADSPKLDGWRAKLPRNSSR